MKIELGCQALYEKYKAIQGSLPLCYCYSPFRYLCFEDGVRFTNIIEKGFYKYDEDDNFYIVFDTYLGARVRKDAFDVYFKKPSKLKLFLYKYFPFLWV